MGWIKKLRLGITSNDGKGAGIRTTFTEIENNLNFLKEKASTAEGMLDSYTLSFTESVVDLSQLDENSYYPVLIKLDVNKMFDIHVRRPLNKKYHKPRYSTHRSGFSAYVRWVVNASGWEEQKVSRTIYNVLFRYADKVPIGEIGQLTNSSLEYIYLRGGSEYEILVRGGEGIDIEVVTESKSFRNQKIGPKSKSTLPKDFMDNMLLKSKGLTSVPVDGMFERDSRGNLYFTNGTIRKKIKFE